MVDLYTYLVPRFEQLGRKADKNANYNGRIECQYYQYYDQDR